MRDATKRSAQAHRSGLPVARSRGMVCRGVSNVRCHRSHFLCQTQQPSCRSNSIEVSARIAIAFNATAFCVRLVHSMTRFDLTAIGVLAIISTSESRSTQMARSAASYVVFARFCGVNLFLFLFFHSSHQPGVPQCTGHVVCMVSHSSSYWW